MKSKLFFLILLLTSSYIIQGQTNIKEGIKIKVLKSRQVLNSSILQTSQVKVKSNKLTRIMIKAKIRSKSSNKAKISAFSLLDTKNMVRYRLADYKGYAGIIGYPEYIPFLKTKLTGRKGRKLINAPPFDASEKDYFLLSDFDGYSNLEIPVNFGTNQNPKPSVIYFGETSFKNFTAELFFAILTIHKGSNFELYYKNEKVSDIKINFR